MGALLLILFRDIYFKANGINGEIYELALVYYRWTPLNAVLNVMASYLSQMVYTDGDETCNNVCYSRLPSRRKSSMFWLARMIAETFFRTRFEAFRI